jgi:hypothetical protein
MWNIVVRAREAERQKAVNNFLKIPSPIGGTSLAADSQWRSKHIQSVFQSEDESIFRDDPTNLPFSNMLRQTQAQTQTQMNRRSTDFGWVSSRITKLTSHRFEISLCVSDFLQNSLSGQCRVFFPKHLWATFPFCSPTFNLYSQVFPFPFMTWPDHDRS